MVKASDYKVIPQEYREEIIFWCGDNVMCKEYLEDILKEHGYTEKDYGWIFAEHDEDLVQDIYHRIFKDGEVEI